MGCKSTKEIKKDIQNINDQLNKYVCKDEVENIKNDMKKALGVALEASMPIFESLLIQKTDIVKQKQASDLTKSFITNTFKTYNEKLEDINNKVIDIDHKKINKPISKFGQSEF